MGDQALFDTLTHEVQKSTDLRFFFRAHQRRRVALPPEMIHATNKPRRFARKIRIKKAHEPCELQGVRNPNEKMVVIGKKGKSVHGH